MNNRMVRSVAVCAVLSACVLVPLALSRRSEAAPGWRESVNRGPQPAFEYCSLRFVRVPGAYQWYFSSPERRLSDSDLERLTQKLGCETRRYRDSESGDVIDILNHLGSQGWELVSHAATGDSREYRQSWHFRRVR
jgi:hypothetical protein